ncbi:MAG TPA: alpha/beta hydrolase [Sphingobacteriaceae bacterium]
MLRIRILFILLCTCGVAAAQHTIPLYGTKSIPNALTAANEEKISADSTAVSTVSNPTLTVYLPEKDKATGMAVIICPGGGYGKLMIKREGHNIAKEFIKMGVAAFVLKYRLPADRIMKDKSIGPLQDALQAIKTVRMNAAEWNISSDKIGIMGFSAGGHLASTAGTHYNEKVIENNEQISLRPDFMILVYPVISLTDSLAHLGSRKNLLGPSASIEQINRFSNELHITNGTPPVFLVHASDDTVVSVNNSVRFYQELIRKKVPAEMHIYSKGEHGFLKKPSFDEWFGRCKAWLLQL